MKDDDDDDDQDGGGTRDGEKGRVQVAQMNETRPTTVLMFISIKIYIHHTACLSPSLLGSVFLFCPHTHTHNI